MNISFAGSLTNFLCSNETKDGNILFTNLTQMPDQPLLYGKPRVDQAPEKYMRIYNFAGYVGRKNCQYVAV